MTERYRCPKCGKTELRRHRGSRVRNYGHFTCGSCGHGLLAEFDPKDLKIDRPEPNATGD